MAFGSPRDPKLVEDMSSMNLIPYVDLGIERLVRRSGEWSKNGYLAFLTDRKRRVPFAGYIFLDSRQRATSAADES